MKKLVFVCSMAACATALATPASTETKPMAGTTNPMAQWTPHKVTKKDVKGIEALYKTCEANMKSGNMEAVTAEWDFPAYMGTDNSAGVTMADTWAKEKWVEMMKPAMEGWPKDAKMTTKTKPFFITDSIAFVEEEHTMTMGKTKQQWTSGSIVVLKDGKWKFKSAWEGGWGDMMGPEKKSVTTTTPPAPGSRVATTNPTK